MLSGRRTLILTLAIAAFAGLSAARCGAQAALLMEEPYGFFGTINPTGHNAIYLERVCAETPLKLRRCKPGELGAVISRYEGIDGYDWIAIPLIPYLYSVETAAQVPQQADRAMVTQMREQYREAHFNGLGLDQSGGSYVRDGWTQLVGAAYERRIYAFRFETTERQDDALIAALNADRNQSHFLLLYRNCADFARTVLDTYFPDTFHRSIFPDAGVTTPKQVAFKLVRYIRKHPEANLTVFEIPQVPGYRGHSHSTKDVAESISTTVYAVPLVLINPYLFGGIFVDYIVRGHYHLVPKDPQVIGPEDLTTLTATGGDQQNSASAGTHAAGAVPGYSATPESAMGAQLGLQKTKATNE